MNETERKQIKGALLKCADENENKVTPTFYVVVSSVCKSAVERIEELEAQIEKMKMCCNCRKWRECGEQLDYVSYPCFQHNCDDVCPIWELWERR